MSLEELIKEHDKNRNFSNSIPEQVKEGKKERENFLKKFPADKILQIKLDEYVAGKEPIDRNTFSYLIEFGSANYGGVQGGSAMKFVIYVNKKSQEYEFKKDIFASKEDAFKSVKNGIHEIVQAAKDFSPDKGDWKKLGQIVEGKKNFLNIALRSKILKVYFPEKFLKLWSHKWMNATLDMFEVPREDLEDNGDFYVKHGRMWDKKQSHPIMKEWTPDFFSYFLDEKRLFGKKPDEEPTTDEEPRFEESDYENYYDILNRKKQIILYGPPGTGKTYTAKKIAEAFTEKKFEESQLPSCFIALGGWSNWSHAKENVPLRWGVDPSTPSNLGVYNSVKEGDYVFFYQNKDEPTKFTKIGLFGVGRVTRKYTSDEPYWPDEISAGNAIYTQRFEMELLKIARDDSEVLPWIDGLPRVKGLNSIKNEEVLTNLLSESKKMWNINLNCTFIKSITFHQSFSYEEFIEGIKAEPHGDSVSYNVNPGIFKEFCSCARRNPKQKFVMIIDEINRGNISKILGELITLLEKDKRGDTATLPYSKDTFSIPENVFVIGTMNTADRSLILLDVALRRRFAFYEVMPDSSLLKNQNIDGVNLTDLLDSINERIRTEDMRDYQIGHSYFMDGEKPIQTADDLKFSMVYEVIPLVKEYFYNEPEKIIKILGEKLGSGESNLEWKTAELVKSLYDEFFKVKKEVKK